MDKKHLCPLIRSPTKKIWIRGSLKNGRRVGVVSRWANGNDSDADSTSPTTRTHKKHNTWLCPGLSEARNHCTSAEQPTGVQRPGPQKTQAPAMQRVPWQVRTLGGGEGIVSGNKVKHMEALTWWCEIWENHPRIPYGRVAVAYGGLFLAGRESLRQPFPLSPCALGCPAPAQRWTNWADH